MSSQEFPVTRGCCEVTPYRERFVLPEQGQGRSTPAAVAVTGSGSITMMFSVAGSKAQRASAVQYELPIPTFLKGLQP